MMLPDSDDLAAVRRDRERTMHEPGRIERDDTVRLLLPPGERDALLKEAAPSAGVDHKLRLGVSRAGLLEFRLTFDELDELQGHIAAAANHTKSRKLQHTLDAVYDKIQKLLDEDADEEE